MGLIILFWIINFIIWFIILPIILMKYFGHRERDFDNEFVFCGFILTALSIIGTIIMIFMLLKEVGASLYQKYIEFIDKKIKEEE